MSDEIDKLAEEVAELEEQATAYDDAVSPLSIILNAANDCDSCLYELDSWLTTQNINKAIDKAMGLSKKTWAKHEQLEAELAELEEAAELDCGDGSDLVNIETL